jgi:uncharacterized damage-inducible protein DinB
MTPDHARMFRDIVVGFLENESKTTRRVIAALPNEGRLYRPDPKSRTAWDLATHLALSDAWFADSILNGAFVWAGEPVLPPEFTDPQGVSAWYAQTMAERYSRLRQLSDEALTREIDFFGTKAPAVMWLLMFLSHMVHHRGQLAAHLRAAGGKVPAIYGVSADENLMGG